MQNPIRKIQNPKLKTKIQNAKSEIQNPKCEILNAKSLLSGYLVYDERETNIQLMSCDIF